MCRSWTTELQANVFCMRWWARWLESGEGGERSRGWGWSNLSARCYPGFNVVLPPFLPPPPPYPPSTLVYCDHWYKQGFVLFCFVLALWGDCKKSRIAPLKAIIIIVVFKFPRERETRKGCLSCSLWFTFGNYCVAIAFRWLFGRGKGAEGRGGVGEGSPMHKNMPFFLPSLWNASRRQ